MYVCICVYIYIYIHTYIHTQIHMYLLIYIYIYIYTCVYIHIYIYIHRFRQLGEVHRLRVEGLHRAVLADERACKILRYLQPDDDFGFPTSIRHWGSCGLLFHVLYFNGSYFNVEIKIRNMLLARFCHLFQR